MEKVTMSKTLPEDFKKLRQLTWNVIAACKQVAALLPSHARIMLLEHTTAAEEELAVLQREMEGR